MALVERGLTSKQIAHELGISPRTVDQHIAAVIDIFQVNNRIAAVACLREMGPNEDAESDAKSEPFMFKYSSREDDIAPGNIGSPSDLSKPALAHKLPLMPALGGSKNLADKKERLSWIFKIALLAIMSSCFLILSIMGLSRMA